MARSTVDNRLNPLDVGLPGTVGASVGVGNLNAEGHALATIITLSHSLHLLLHDDLKISPLQALRYDTKVCRKKQVFFSRKFAFFKIVLLFASLAGIMSVSYERK